MNKPGLGLLITCEHAGNRIPAEYHRLFYNHSGRLSTHQGFDIGAKELANGFARRFSTRAILFEQTRLFIDVNRSLSSRSLFSFIGSTLSVEERRLILKTHYHRYRNSIQEQIETIRQNQIPVIHLSVHTFTPVLQGKSRNADVGFLYDPSRKMEKRFCHRWLKVLKQKNPDLTIRCNYPYRGVSDGLTASLRRTYPEGEYVGIELEVNQKYPRMKRVADWEALKKDLIETFYKVALAR